MESPMLNAARKEIQHTVNILKNNRNQLQWVYIECSWRQQQSSTVCINCSRWQQQSTTLSIHWVFLGTTAIQYTVNVLVNKPIYSACHIHFQTNKGETVIFENCYLKTIKWGIQYKPSDLNNIFMRSLVQQSTTINTSNIFCWWFYVSWPTGQCTAVGILSLVKHTAIVILSSTSKYFLCGILSVFHPWTRVFFLKSGGSEHFSMTNEKRKRSINFC